MIKRSVSNINVCALLRGSSGGEGVARWLNWERNYEVFQGYYRDRFSLILWYKLVQIWCNMISLFQVCLQDNFLIWNHTNTSSFSKVKWSATNLLILVILQVLFAGFVGGPPGGPFGGPLGSMSPLSICCDSFTLSITTRMNIAMETKDNFIYKK